MCCVSFGRTSSHWSMGVGVSLCCVIVFHALLSCMLTVLCVCCVFMCTSACESLVCIVLNVEGGDVIAQGVLGWRVCSVL